MTAPASINWQHWWLLSASVLGSRSIDLNKRSALQAFCGQLYELYKYVSHYGIEGTKASPKAYSTVLHTVNCTISTT